MCVIFIIFWYENYSPTQWTGENSGMNRSWLGIVFRWPRLNLRLREKGRNILIQNSMRLNISWYNQFSSKRTKGVIFNSTGEERWGGKAISKYTITSQTETSNPNITRHAPHQRQLKIENKWRETIAQNLVWEGKIEEAFYKILSLAIIWYQTLWWPRVADPLNYPVINTFSATQTLTWTQFVQTLTLSDVIKRLS